MVDAARLRADDTPLYLRVAADVAAESAMPVPSTRSR